MVYISEQELCELWRVGYDEVQALRNSGALRTSNPESRTHSYDLAHLERLHQQWLPHSDSTIPGVAVLLANNRPDMPSLITIEEAAVMARQSDDGKIRRLIAIGRLAAIRIGYYWRIPRACFIEHLAGLNRTDVLSAQAVANIMDVHVATIWRTSVGRQAAFERMPYPQDRRVVGITEASLLAYLESKLVNTTPDEWMAMRVAGGFGALLNRKEIQHTYHVHQRVTTRLVSPGGLPCLFTPSERPMARIPLHIVKRWALARQTALPPDEITKIYGMPLMEAVDFSLTLAGVLKAE